MMNKTVTLLVLMASLMLAVVGEATAEANDHGQRTVIGNVDVSGQSFEIALFGGIQPNQEAAFEVASNESIAGLSTFLWVESKDGERLSAPAKAIVEGDKLHFHVVPKEEPFQVVLRVRGKGVDERGSLSLPEIKTTAAPTHGHGHNDQHSHGEEHGHSH